MRQVGLHRPSRTAVPDGRILRTRISHPPDRTTYGRSLFAHVLRDQLQVSEDEFWACVRQGQTPPRGTLQATTGSLPAELVHLLLTRVGLGEHEVARMSRDEAVERLNRYWAEGG